MPPTLAFLHTSPVHVAPFDALVHRAEPTAKTHHVVDEALLADARRLGADDEEIQRRVAEAMWGAAAGGALVVMCTCSTLGGVAERMDTQGRFAALRVDRAMADEAVRLGPSVLVVAALQSTLAPTRELILDSARRLGLAVDARLLLVEQAWAHFERGDMPAYLEAIAQAVRAAGAGHQVVVLAQASMAGAEPLLADLGLPVLSSPRLGVAAALAQAAMAGQAGAA